VFSLKKNSPRSIAVSNNGTHKAQEDRYNPAFKAFADINSEARVQRKNAMIFAAGCLLVAGIEAYGQAAASSRPAMVPYVIKVDEHGKAVDLGVPPRLDQDPTTTQLAVQYQLRQFIQNMRSVSYDPGFQTKMVTDYVKPFLAGGTEATTLVNDFYKENDPYKIAQKGNTIDAQVKSVIPQDSTTFAIDWVEVTKSANGIVINTSEWNGFATVELGEIPTDPEARNLNPLGMYVHNLTWQNVTVRATPSPSS
jgi:type IV secretory pathway TrbF-like protein